MGNHFRKVITFFIGLICSECQINDVLICTGDDVLISSNNEKKPYIAHVKQLFESRDPANPNRADIFWYFRYEELSTICKEQIPGKPNKGELYLPINDNGTVPNSEENIDAETIVRRCNVLKYKLSATFPCGSNEGTFVVRYSFDRHNNVFPVMRRTGDGTRSTRKSKGSLSTQSNGEQTPVKCTPKTQQKKKKQSAITAANGEYRMTRNRKSKTTSE